MSGLNMKAYTAALADAQGHRECVFAPGEKVTCRGNWGPLVGALRVYDGNHPGAVYTVHATQNGAMSVRDRDGRVYGQESYGPAYGWMYFRIAGECGDHFPAFRDHSYYCARCDEPTPMDVVEVLHAAANSEAS